MQSIERKQLNIYVTKDGKKPFVDWLESLDKTVRYRVKERLDRITLGNLGDYKLISDGIFELRLKFGCGYRIYCGNEENQIVLLLCGGNKATQKKDIKKAMAYWEDYLLR